MCKGAGKKKRKVSFWSDGRKSSVSVCKGKGEERNKRRKKLYEWMCVKGAREKRERRLVLGKEEKRKLLILVCVGRRKGLLVEGREGRAVSDPVQGGRGKRSTSKRFNKERTSLSTSGLLCVSSVTSLAALHTDAPQVGSHYKKTHIPCPLRRRVTRNYKTAYRSSTHESDPTSSSLAYRKLYPDI